MTASSRLVADGLSAHAHSWGGHADLNAGQMALVWGLVLAVHAGAAMWLWREASEPVVQSEPTTISVVMMDNDVPVPPAPPAPPSPAPDVPPAPEPVPPAPAVRNAAAARTPSVLATPTATPTAATVPTAAPATPTDTPTPVAAAAPAVVAATTAPPAPPAPAAPKTLPSSAVRYLVKPAQSYPRASRDLGESGEVLLRVLVDEQGRPRDIEVAKSSGFPRLDRAAVQAMRAARFQPHIEDGQPRMVWAQAPITYQLDEF